MRRWTALLLTLALLLVSGCQKEAERSSLPKLELHREEEKDYLLLEGVRYNRVSTDTPDAGGLPGRQGRRWPASKR